MVPVMNLFEPHLPDVLQEKAIALLKPLIPSDAEDRVANTVRQFNQILREQIRLETALRLPEGTTVPINVTEGFPTPIAHRKLVARTPGILEAFFVLLENQPRAYQAYRDWLPDSPERRRETIRFAMLRARNQGCVDERGWLQMLRETSQTLGSH